MMVLIIFVSVSLIILLFLLWQCLVNLKRYKLSPRESDASLRLEDTPTISLCIPARNETHALEDCLISAVASDYLKLEIIVLDDCSQDRTSHIIRSFAQDGIRFVKGTAPSDGWLGKNHAYEILSQEARGDYLVFMSVDTRLEPRTLSMLMGYMQVNKLSMVSVLPRRPDGWRTSVLLAPLRYFWQVVLPLGFNIPTATSLWAIRSKSLITLGGFSAYKDKIMPENILAQKFFSNAQYHFLIANHFFKVWYAKKWSSQAETAIRLWYPLLKKSLIYCLSAIVFHFLLFILPLICLMVGVISGSLILTVISLVALLISFGLFFFYLRRIQTGIPAILIMILLPMIALQEIILIIISVYQYKQGHVSWKGRNICYPVLKHIN